VGTIRKKQIFRDAGDFITKGKIIYVHQGIGMGVLFLDLASDQLRVLDFWLAISKRTRCRGMKMTMVLRVRRSAGVYRYK
jgi:hypothetical protein